MLKLAHILLAGVLAWKTVIGTEAPMATFEMYHVVYGFHA